MHCKLSAVEHACMRVWGMNKRDTVICEQQVPLAEDSRTEKRRLEQNRRAGALPAPGIPRKVSLRHS